MKLKQWIRCADALPDTDTPVLVTFDSRKGERVAQATAILDESGDWRWWHFDEGEGNPKVSEWIDIVAWQPLPTPFGGDDDREDRVQAIMTFVHLTLPTLRPIGESDHDARVSKNIERLGDVVYLLTDELCDLVKTYSGHMYPSERQCASTAQDYINDLKELLEEE